MISEELLSFSIKTAVLGLAAGFIVGYLFKKVSKIVIVVVIAAIILFQFGIYDGFININWLTYQPLVEDAIENAGFSFEIVKQVFLDNLAFSIFVIAGFIFGLQRG